MPTILRYIFTFAGSVAALIAMLLLTKTVWTANQSNIHPMKYSEQMVITPAKQYVTKYKKDHLRFPSKMEFEAWASTLDEQVQLREGRGFTYIHPCGKSGEDYCFSYWNGEIYVSFSSAPEHEGMAILDGSFWPFFDSKAGTIAVFSFLMFLSSAFAFLLLKLVSVVKLANERPRQ